MSKSHVPEGQDLPGTLYVTPTGRVYRLRKYEQDIADLMRLDDEAPYTPTYDVFTENGGAAGGVRPLPDDAEVIWRPKS